MTPTRVVVAVLVPLAGVGACNALNGVGDLEEVPCTAACDGAEADATSADGAIGDAPAGDTGSGSDGSGSDTGGPPRDGGSIDAATPPSFCTGITLYLPFDKSTNTEAGEQTVDAATTPLVAGKFGNAADLSGASTAAQTALYYATSFNGSSTYSVAQGTFAAWIKPTFTMPCVAEHVFEKPRVDTTTVSTTSAGPMLTCSPGLGIFGLDIQEPDGGIVKCGVSLGALNEWIQNGWNHVVATWTESPFQLGFVLNGGASVMGRASSTEAWTPSESPANFLRLGSATSTPNSLFDEVVVWSRVLKDQEILDLYQSTVSVGTACNL
jgi:hypothetical protein